MSQTEQTTNQVNPLSAPDGIAKTNLLIAYCLMLLGLLVGVFGVTGLLAFIFWISGGAWAIFKKEEVQGTLFEDHYKSIVEAFWWGLGISIVGVLTVMVGVGIILLLVGWLWLFYRVVRGLAKITSNKPYT